MNILIACYENYPHIGGKSTHIKNLTKGLTELGHYVKIISFADNSYFLKLLLVRAPGFILRKIPAYGKKLSFFWTNFWVESLIKNLITQELKTNKYDAISAQDASVSRICRNIIDNLGKNIPLITTVHGDQKNEILSAGIISKGTFIERWLLNREVSGYTGSDLIIAVDNRLKEHVCSLSLNKAKRKQNIKVMFNFLDVTEFTPSDIKKREDARSRWSHQINIDGCVLLCPRRLTAKNGVIYAAQMCKYLKQAKPSFKFQLVFAGEGENRDKINQIIHENKLEGNIRLLGDVKHEDMLSLYALADIVIVPSVPSEGVIEATSLSALEAMASGVSVIASNIGGLAELISNESTGILVEPTDAGALADAVFRLVSDRDFKAIIQKQAVDYVRNNHSHLVAARLFANYCEDVTFTN